MGFHSASASHWFFTRKNGALSCSKCSARTDPSDVLSVASATETPLICWSMLSFSSRAETSSHLRHILPFCMRFLTKWVTTQDPGDTLVEVKAACSVPNTKFFEFRVKKNLNLDEILDFWKKNRKVIKNQRWESKIWTWKHFSKFEIGTWKPLTLKPKIGVSKP